MRTAKRLIVNADDFGFTKDVNEGILHCHRNGIVRSTSLMANGAAFEDAVKIALAQPSLDVGCHLVLVQGKSVSRPGTPLPSSIGRLLAALPEHADIVREFRAQVDKLLAHGLRPTHLDTHKHVHLLPQVLDALVQVADSCGIRWIRKPFDIPRNCPRTPRVLLSAAIRPFRIPFEEILRRARCRTPDYFAGVAATGSLDRLRLEGLLEGLGPGLGELVCHPGRFGPELSAAPTRLKRSRQDELEALCHPSVRRIVNECGIELVSYRDLP